MAAHFGDIEGAEGIFDAMSAEAKDIATYNAMMAAFAANGDLERVRELFLEVRARGIARTKRTFIAMISVCARRGDATEAKRIWHCEMADEAEEVRFDAFVVTSVVDCLAPEIDME